MDVTLGVSVAVKPPELFAMLNGDLRHLGVKVEVLEMPMKTAPQVLSGCAV